MLPIDTDVHACPDPATMHHLSGTESESESLLPIQLYDVNSTNYMQVFALLLRQSNEREAAIHWLRQGIEQMPARSLFVDVGAGTGWITAALQDAFARTIAIEPNVLWHTTLRDTCPQAEVIPCAIEEVTVIDQPADFILCAHVFYHIAATEWQTILEKLIAWLTPSGSVMLVLTDPDADTMAVREHFYQQRVDIAKWAQAWQSSYHERIEVTITRVPSYIWAASAAEAYALTEFMLNWSPGPTLPLRRAVEMYIQANFYQSDQRYRLSCDQTFVQLWRKA